MTVDFEAIGKRVKVYRTKRQMTQAELAERLGISNVYISNIETGLKGVSLKVLLKIADEFDLSLDSLVLEETHIRLPKAYRKLADMLADCDFEEIEQIIEIIPDYIKMIRADNV
jgi:transcriptional regulator with XRE-family HTH domain